MISGRAVLPSVLHHSVLLLLQFFSRLSYFIQGLIISPRLRTGGAVLKVYLTPPVLYSPCFVGFIFFNKYYHGNHFVCFLYSTNFKNSTIQQDQQINFSQ